MPSSPALVTRWRSYLDVSGDAQEMAWAELFDLLSHPSPYAGETEHPGWSPVRCDPPTRKDNHVQEICALVLDYDGAGAIEQARDLWGALFGCVHTTRKHSEGSHRFRVVLALSRRATPAEHPILWRWANARVVRAGSTLDASTRNVSRFWYLPGVKPGAPFEFHMLDGNPIDVDAVLAEVAATREPPRVAESRRDDSITMRIRRASHYIAKMDPAVAGAGGHQQAWAVALVLTLGFDLPPSVAGDLFAREYNPRCSPPWSDREVEHKIKTAETDGRVPRGYLLDGGRSNDWHTRFRAPVPGEPIYHEAPAYEDEERAAIQAETPSAPPPRKRAFAVLTAPDIFAPLPPIPWLVEGLDLTPGAPAMFAGYGYSRKTIAAQSLAIQVAAGRRIWGEFTARKGRVLHIDYEQGNRLTRQRYIRLALGDQLCVEDVDGSLDLVCLPSVYLDAPKASDIFCAEFEGYDCVIVDSFRAAAPSADENSSDVRRHLDVLTRASERTGATVIVIHHSGKPQAHGSGDGRMALRGSSGIFDACSSVFIFAAEKDQPTKVEHVKARVSGVLQPDFYLDTEDIPMEGIARAGLLVKHKSDEQVTTSKGGLDASKYERQKATVLALLRQAGSIHDTESVAARSEVRKSTVLVILRELVAEGKVHAASRDGKGGPFRPIA